MNAGKRVFAVLFAAAATGAGPFLSAAAEASPLGPPTAALAPAALAPAAPPLEGNVTQGNVTQGSAAQGNTLQGNATDSQIASGAATVLAPDTMPISLASAWQPVGLPAVGDDSIESELSSLRDSNHRLQDRIAALEANQASEADPAPPSPDDASLVRGASFRSLAAQGPVVAPGTISPNYFAAGPAGSWIGGVSVYVLAPRWSGGNTAYYTSTPASPVFADSYTVSQFRTPAQAAPAGWIGYVHASGYGARVNFFYYNQYWGSTGTSSATTDITDGTGTVSTINGAPGTTTPFKFGSSLMINAWDIEGTRTVSNENWTATAGAGVRYVYMNQAYTAQSNLGGLSMVSTRNMFNGVGPTLSAMGRRRLGASGLGFYSNGRGAILFGSHLQSMQTNFGSNVSEGFDQAKAASQSWSVMPYAQLEFGVDYRRPVLGGRSQLVIENGFVAMAFFNAGTPSNTQTMLQPIEQGTSPLSSATLGLIGLRSSVGFVY